MQPLPPVIAEPILSQMVDAWYTKMLDDYRINRYFYPRPLAEQTTPLKALLANLLSGQPVAAQHLSEMADAAFTAAFARGNAKPSMVNNRDFAFLGALMNGNIVGDDDGTPRLTLLCPGHSHFLRLQPIDEVFDIALELLQATSAEIGLDRESGDKLLAWMATAKGGIMGHGRPIFDDEEQSSRFRTHG